MSLPMLINSFGKLKKGWDDISLGIKVFTLGGKENIAITEEMAIANAQYAGATE